MSSQADVACTVSYLQELPSTDSNNPDHDVSHFLFQSPLGFEEVT